MNPQSRLRVLVIAEACNPSWTSVPLVGYNAVRELASRDELDVTIATHPRNRPDLESDVISNLATFVYPDNEYVAKRLYDFAQWFRGGKGKGWTTNTAFQAVSYLFFERELFRLLQPQLESNQFDIIHRITPVTPTAGSPLASWTKTPMVVGPMNGGLPWPKEYPELRQKENEFLVPLRKAYKLFPYYKSTYDRIRVAIAGSQHTLSEIPKRFTGRKMLIPENGVDPRRFKIAKDWTPPIDKFRFITVGRLVPYKGLWLTLEAMRESRSLRECELIVVGDGPDREAIEQRIKEYNLTEQVQLRGWLEQHELAELLSESQSFVFPSLREFGGGVVLEAMASGLPSIVVDYGGPTDLIDKHSGILLPMQPPNQMVQALRHAMEGLVDDHHRCRGYALNAIKQIESKFTWAAKAKQFSRIYHEVLEREPCPTTLENAPATLASTF